jgi:Xylose isomerase-like TIM barrel
LPIHIQALDELESCGWPWFIGVYGGYQGWVDRAGRFRSLGDGQIDFRTVFSKMAQYDFPGWAVLEWECALKHPEAGAKEGAEFIRKHIVPVADHSFDDFAAVRVSRDECASMLGMSSHSA